MDRTLSSERSTVSPDPVFRKLLIECGEHSLREFESTEDTDVIDQIKAVRNIAARHGIDLEMLIYSGVSSPLSGGRPDRVSLQRCEALANSLNSTGLRFCLAINGGLTLGPTLSREILAQVDPLLDVISRSGQTHRVRNSVVIVHPGLFRHIRSYFSELETIASCIQPLYPFADHDYLQAFEDYDYVVPLNQHATPQFLKQYRDYVDQMLIFLTLECGIPHFAKCYAHYVAIESDYRTSESTLTRINPKSLDVVPCQLEERYCGCDDGALIDREDDLAELLRMGVWKFKVPRNGLLRRQVLTKLLQMFDLNRPATASPRGRFAVKC